MHGLLVTFQVAAMNPSSFNKNEHDTRYAETENEDFSDGGSAKKASTDEESIFPDRSLAPVFVKNMTPLGPGYTEPGPFDVICGKGKHALRHSGNIRFRSMIEEKLSVYAMATTKLEKSTIVSSILDGVRDKSPLGGFVRCENGQWFEVGDHLAREKIGQR
jgi:hypothetical protein